MPLFDLHFVCLPACTDRALVDTLFCRVITDLIQEATQTKVAIDDATDAMYNAAEATHHTEQKKDVAMQMSSTFESNLFDFHGGSAPAPAPSTALYSQAPAVTRQPTDDAAIVPVVQTVSSDVEDANEDNNDLAKTAVAPATAPSQAPALAQQYQATSYPAPATTPQRYQAPGPAPQHQAPPTPQYQQPLAGFGQPASAQPSPQLARPGAMGVHPRQISHGFDVGSLMGGSADPLPTDNGFSPAARATSSSADFGYEDEEMFQRVEDMKKKAERAAEAARDAEVAHQKLVNEADELRGDADKAEANARSLKAAASEKAEKKGRFGRKSGDQKKINVSDHFNACVAQATDDCC
jgi:hypothetical protein